MYSTSAIFSKEDHKSIAHLGSQQLQGVHTLRINLKTSYS
uniref:Uncharacterized protein n=1 Tax=Arundo donax TaxID=35708 RepID=A0A0A8YFA6_ARUDO